MESLHTVLAYILVALSLEAAIFSLLVHYGKFAKPKFERYTRWLLYTVYVGFFAQALIGAVLLNSSGGENGIHEFYGYFTLAFIAFLAVYKSQLIDSMRYFQIHGFANLFLWGMALRAIFIDS